MLFGCLFVCFLISICFCTAEFENENDIIKVLKKQPPLFEASYLQIFKSRCKLTTCLDRGYLGKYFNAKLDSIVQFLGIRTWTEAISHIAHIMGCFTIRVHHLSHFW